MKSAEPPRINLVAVGNELLSADRLESNSHEIQALLLHKGLEVSRCAVVGDDCERIAAELRHALTDSDLVIVTGGLGPTIDDVTREGAAAVAGVDLEEDPIALAEIEQFFKARNRRMVASNRRQALIPAGAELILNPVGTAPGFALTLGGKELICLPGVPAEMRTLMAKSVLPRLPDLHRGEGALVQERVHLVGITESSVNEQIRPLENLPGLQIGITVHQAVITIKLTSRERHARKNVDQGMTALREIFGDRVFGEGSANRLADVVGALLIEQGITLALAESCTGGLVGHMMTSVPGISSVFLEGTVAYSVDAKMRTLNVPEKLIIDHGQVSAEVARALAQGAAARSGARAGIGITGIAGPGGGTEEKPVGTVHMAVFLDGETLDRKYLFSGDREMVKIRSATLALDLLRRAILGSA